MTSNHPLAGYHVGPVGFFSKPAEFTAAPDRHESRGLLWTWELPKSTESYVIGCDPTVGLMGWNIWSKTSDDRKVDNAAIEVIRKGRSRIVESNGEQRLVREPDVQVAEYAAPIDYKDCAAALNAIGKMYRGSSEDEGCLINWESGPGAGVPIFAELYSTWGYTNLFMQGYLDTTKQKAKPDYGFWSNQQSKQLLWSKGIRHIHSGGLTINSPWLLEEMVDANSDKFVFKTIKTGPTHDDRFTAILLAIWAANSWSFDQDDVEQTRLEPIGSNGPDPQRMLMTSTQAKALEEERWAQLMEQFED